MTRPLASQWFWRTALFACVIVLPFGAYLASSGYPSGGLETVAAIVLLFFTCGLLATVFRNEAFLIAMVVCASAVAAPPLQRYLTAWFACPLPVVWFAFAFLLAGLVRLNADHFLRIVAVVAVAAFALELYQTLHPAAEQREEPSRQPQPQCTPALYAVLFPPGASLVGQARGLRRPLKPPVRRRG